MSGKNVSSYVCQLKTDILNISCNIVNLWTGFAQTIKFCYFILGVLVKHILMYSNYIKQVWWAAFIQMCYKLFNQHSCQILPSVL